MVATLGAGFFLFHKTSFTRSTMLLPVTAMPSHTNSPRSFLSALISALSLSTNHLAFFLRVFRMLSAMSASTRSTAAVPAASVSAASPAACFFLRRPIVHHGHSCRLLRTHIIHVVDATQELIVQRYLLPSYKSIRVMIAFNSSS